jgi:DNA-binding response OmpR family regulator
MAFPLDVPKFPDTPTDDVVLGSQERAVLAAMAQKPGKVFSREDLAAHVRWSSLTSRRLEELMDTLRAKVGADAVVAVPRRGWTFRPATA